MKSIRSDLDLAFSSTTAIEGDSPDEIWELARHPAGALRLEDGRVAVGDPLTGGLHGVLARRVAPGSYPVDLAIVSLAPDHQRVAAARLLLSDRPVVRWEPAEFEGSTSSAQDQPAYGVDAGTGFIGCGARSPALDTEEDGEALLAAVLEGGGLAHPHPSAPDAALTFTSGWGDGMYVSWWGIDDQGDAAALVTDFEVLTCAIWERFTVTLPLPWGKVHHPLLANRGLTLSRSLWRSNTLVCAGGAPAHLRVLTPEVLAVPAAGSWGRWTYALPPHPAGAALEVAVRTGNRARRGVSPL
ncbi:MAG: DUF4241 domain-containing protein [Deltaproteobacteria bacterium]|nr:DUF4241 domain-containing protein [Deltaproteobacteria bacterium]